MPVMSQPLKKRPYRRNIPTSTRRQGNHLRLQGGRYMRAVARTGAAVLCLVLLPAMAFAQASIAGIVRDTSGAVLPGVTVEAASPALLEKVRTAVTDGNGQYRIEALRPGPYTVTFTLTGFNVVKREGIQLSGSFTASVDADMRVGTLEETITV